MIEKINERLHVFRDDVYPFLGGGNKGRKIQYIGAEVIAQGCNAVVTTGGIQSNHCRALAVMAARNKWKCTLVLHGSKALFESSGGNALIMRLSGATIIFAEPNQISVKMDSAMQGYLTLGDKPYYIWGGGHTLEGGFAYIEAIKELKEYILKQHWAPDYIFLASGTGSTQAGILTGLDKYNINAEVVGISVARKRQQGENVVSDFYDKLTLHYGIPSSKRKVTVLDDFLCGGYEQYNDELLALSHHAIELYGFTLDTTYSGKAFYGMNNYIEENNIQGNILFWHTGGLLNFLAQKI